MNKKTISDIITEEEIKSWDKNIPIIINANTGDGKTYWCLNILYKYAKKHGLKILMLVPRIRCRGQFTNQLEQIKNVDDVITIKTYQSIEFAYKNNYDLNLNNYDYIVCDEAHYFVNDSQFNRYCDISFDEIYKTDAIKIYMSATIDFIDNYLKVIYKTETKRYELPLHYDNFKSVVYYTKEESLYEILDILTLDKTEKTILFINDIKRGLEIARRYNGAFICSESNNNFKYADKNEIYNIESEEHFESNLLITTTTLDVGITLKDKKLTSIIIDNIYDIDIIKQILGRKRSTDEDDKYSCLYLSCPNNNKIGGQITKYSKEIERGDYLFNNGSKKYLEKYSKERDYVRCIYDDCNGDKKLNLFMYCNFRLDKTRCQKILECGCFSKYITKELKLEENNIRYFIFEDVIGVIDLESYLKMNVDKIMYTKEDKSELIQRIGVRDNKGRLLKNINTLNGALEEMNSKYRIMQFETSKIIDGKKKNFRSAWKIIC